MYVVKIGRSKLQGGKSIEQVRHASTVLLLTARGKEHDILVLVPHQYRVFWQELDLITGSLCCAAPPMETCTD